MLVKSIFFDLDHTLWDFEKNSELSFKKIFKKYGITINFNKFIKAYVPINFRYWKLYRNGEITKDYLRHNRLKEVFDVFDYEIDNLTIDKIAEDYINFLPENNKLMEGALEILDYLKPKYRLFIITNGFREVQDKKLINSRIKHYFEAIYDSESVGVKKPDSKIFIYALTDSGSKAEESLMVGDNYEADILGAQKLKIKAIHFAAHGEEIHNKKQTIQKLIELKAFL